MSVTPDTGGPKRRALLFSMQEFASKSSSDDPEPEINAFEFLARAHEATEELKVALECYGYVVEHQMDAPAIDNAGSVSFAKSILKAIRDATSDDLVIAHVASHGVITETDFLSVVGSDGETDADTYVDIWIRFVEDRFQHAPLVLFVIDTCHSGAAARLDFQIRSGRHPRALVLAATTPTDPAFDCRFTSTVAKVLTQFATDKTLIDHREPWIPWNALRAKIKWHMSNKDLGVPQTVTSTMYDDDIEQTFFPNQFHAATSPAALALGSLPTSLQEFTGDFLGDAFDRDHFQSRAGRPAVDSLSPIGVFQGRTQQLTELSRWLDGVAPDASQSRLVTGAPGAGKSALLGVLVCAAHPALRDETQPLWAHLPAVPSRNTHLAAIHARRRTLTDIVASLTNQLGLHLSGPSRSATALVEGIIGLPSAPTIVLDALDEANHPPRLIDALLRPLIRATRLDGTPACRVLIASRSGVKWPAVDALIDELEPSGVTNLDHIGEDQLRADLSAFTNNYLGRQAGWDAVEHAALRTGVTEAIAETLTAAQYGSSNATEWGAFLVASLFVQTLVRTVEPADGVNVEKLVERIPRTLPDVLDLDLETRGDQAEKIRLVLRALALAEGEGMPATVLTDTVNALNESASAPIDLNDVELSTLLDGVSSYLRTSVDNDSAVLYRLFHQGLTDHLLDFVSDDDRAAIWVRLCPVKGGLGRRAWDTAEDYLARHALEHANNRESQISLLTDWDFLAVAEPSRILMAFHTIGQSSDLELPRAIYRAAAASDGLPDPETRRSRLALEAARIRERSAADTVLSTETFKVAWSTASGRLSERHIGEISSGLPSARAIAAANLSGADVAITGENDGSVRVWSTVTREQIRLPQYGHDRTVWSVAAWTQPGKAPDAYDTTYAISGGDDGTVLVWNLGPTQTGYENDTNYDVVIPTTVYESETPVWAVKATTVGETTLVASGLRNGTLIFDTWPSTTPRIHPGHDGGVVAISIFDSQDGPRVVSSSHDRTVRVWDYATGDELWRLPLRNEWVAALDTFVLNRVPHLLVGHSEGRTSTWNLHTRTVVDTSPDLHAGKRVGSVATVVDSDGHTFVISGGYDGTIQTRNVDKLTPRTGPMRGHRDRIGALAAWGGDNPIAITRGRGDDSSVRAWDLADGPDIDNWTPGHVQTAGALVVGTIEDTDVVATAGVSHDVRLWDLRTGRLIADTGRISDADLAFVDSASGMTLAAMDNFGGVTIHDVADDLRRIRRLDPPTGRWSAYRFGPQIATLQVGNDPVLLHVAHNGTMRLFSPDRKRQLGRLGINPTARRALSAGRAYNRSYALSAVVKPNHDGLETETIEVWNVNTRELRGNLKLKGGTDPTLVGEHRIASQNPAIRTQVVAVRGAALGVVAYRNGAIGLWSLANRERWGVGELQTAGGLVAAHCRAREDELVAAIAFADNTIRFWDLLRGASIGSTVHLPEQVSHLMWNQDHRLAVAYGSDIAVLEVEL